MNPEGRYVKARSGAFLYRPRSRCRYPGRRTIDLGEMAPLVALPDAVIRRWAFDPRRRGRAHQPTFIGSCASNAADRQGGEVAEGHRLQQVYNIIVTRRLAGRLRWRR